MTERILTVLLTLGTFFSCLSARADDPRSLPSLRIEIEATPSGDRLKESTQEYKGSAGYFAVSQHGAVVSADVELTNAAGGEVTSYLVFTAFHYSSLEIAASTLSNRACDVKKVETHAQEWLPSSRKIVLSTTQSPFSRCSFKAVIKNPLTYTLRWEVMTPRQFENKYSDDHAFLVLYLAVVMCLVLIFVTMSFSTSERVFFWYSTYALSFSVGVMVFEDALPPAILNIVEGYFPYAIHICGLLITYSFLEFSRYFLEMGRDAPRLREGFYRGANVIRILAGTVFVYAMFSPVGLSLNVGFATAVTTVVFVLSHSLLLVRTSPTARMFTLSLIVVLFVQLITGTDYVGMPLTSTAVEHPAIFVSLAETVCLAVCLAAQFSRLKTTVETQDKLMLETERMRVMGEMAATIVHEIKNLLFSAQLRVERAKRLLSQPQAASDKAEIELVVADKAFRSINRVIATVTKLSNRADNFPFEKVDVRAVLLESVELINERIAMSNCKLHFDVPERAVYGNGRAVQIMQVFINLLSNAADAVSGLEERFIAVKLSACDKLITVSVTNSGPKVGSEVIFGGVSTQQNGRVGLGAGLGLRISRRIAEEHSGRLHVDEEAEHTKVVLSLPALTIWSDC